MTDTIDRWIQLAELAKIFGLSEESIKRLADEWESEPDTLSICFTNGAVGTLV